MCTDKDGLRKEIFGDGTVSSVDDAGNACDKFTYNLDANARSISFVHSSFTAANDVGEFTFVIKGYKTGQGDSRFRSITRTLRFTAPFDCSTDTLEV